MTKYAPADCDLCPALASCRTQIVEGRGSLGYVMFVGLAPGDQEDEKGKAFVGPSGKLLALLSQAAGIAVGDLYLTNALYCHPPGNRRPKVDEIRACRPFLIQEIEAVKPRVIVTLGDVALQSALGRATTLGSVLGQTLKQPETGIPLIPTYHPAFLLRGQWQVADLVTGHIEKARETADGERGELHMGEYETADTIEKLRLLRDYLLHPDTTEIAFDTETTGLDWREDELLCISFATQPGEGFVVPILSHRNVPRPEKPKGRKTRPPWPVDAHWDEDDWPEVLEILREIFASGIKKVGQNCFAPETRVLTADLRWVPMAEIEVGDTLVAFEEESQGQGHARRYLPTRVLAKKERMAEAIEIAFADGTTIITTPEHPFLSAGRRQQHRWTRPKQWERRRPQVARLFDCWNDNGNDNWLAGFLDGDGALSDQPQLLLGQLPGELAERYKDELTRRGYTYNSRTRQPKGATHGRKPFEQITTHGSLARIARLLGTVRSQKLLNHFQRFLARGRWEIRPQSVAITRVRSLGRQHVVNIETGSRTFIAEGWAVHNCIFDVQFLERSPDVPYVTAATAFGFEIKGQIEDTMLLHHAIAEAAMPAEARRTKRSSLTILAAQYSDLPYYEEKITIASSNKRRMADVPDEMLWEYSAADADAVLRVAAPLRAKAEAEGTLWASEQIIQPLIRCCWEMEKRGVLVDMEYFDRLCQHYRDRIEEAETELWAIELPETKPPWKYLHAGALQRVLFQELKLPPSGIKTDSSRGCEACGAGLCFEHEGTGKDALAIIEAQTDHPIIPILRELRKLRKALSTSLDGGKGGFRRHIGPDKRVRSQYRPGGAETTRLSSSDPDMQNVPKDVEIKELDTKNAFRQMFVAPKSHGLMEADWSQLEVWVLAYTLAEEIGESGLLEVLQAGKDVHTWAARNIARRMQGGLDEDLSDLEWKTEHPELRHQAKPFTFGANYGLTPEGLLQKNMTDTIEEAAELLDAYIDTVPGLRAYHHYVRRCIVEDGYLKNKFEQRRHFPSAALLKACRRIHDLEALVREGYAYPIQSGGSTLHSAAHHLTEFTPVLIKRDCRAVISVHDSLAFEFHWPSDSYAETTARIIKDLWEQTAATLILPDGSRLGWQIPVDVQWGRSWGTMDHSLSAKGDLREE